MYYSCHCIKRNGLQHDCRRTGCGGEPACLVLPDPLCAPSQLTRARGLADPAPLAAHIRAQGGGASGGAADAGSSGGKRFIVCELKGIVPDASGADKSGKCCKCPSSFGVPTQSSGGQACVCSSGFSAPKVPVNRSTSRCPCSSKSAAAAAAAEAQNQNSIFVLDEKTLNTIMSRLESKEKAPSDMVMGPGGRLRKAVKPASKEETCTRPGCVHWQPPPPCVWDLPCKADCFETPVGIQPGRNPLTAGGGSCIRDTSGTTSSGAKSARAPMSGERVKLLTPECCTGCSSGGGGASSSGGPAAGLPVLVMKLC